MIMLKSGQQAPNFKVKNIKNKTIELHEIKNRKILLTFFRYAECALCNLRISELKSVSNQLRDNDIHLIAVFQSNAQSLIDSIQNRHEFDFTIIADIELKLYDLYQVKPSWIKLIRTSSLKGIKNMAQASSRGFKLGGRVDGKFNQIPADFLIDSKKKIEIAHYGNSVIDHIAIDKLFL